MLPNGDPRQVRCMTCMRGTPATSTRSSSHCPFPPGACGLAVGIGGKLVGLDLFDSTEALRRQWPRMIASAAMARLDFRRRVAAGILDEAKHQQPDSGALGRMLERARTAVADARVTPSPGEGLDVRLAGRKLHGSALVHGERVVHLALFRDEQPKPPRRVPPPPVRREYEPEQPQQPEQAEHLGVPVRRRS